MLDIGWTELLVIGALALIVVGPRDLPQLLRTVGQTVGKVKRMAREFQRSMEDAARETDLANFKEMRDLKKDMGSFDFRAQAAKAQSYMNKPVGAKDAAAGGAAAATAGEAAPDVSAGASAGAGSAGESGAGAAAAAASPAASPAAPSSGPSSAAPSAASGTAAPARPEAGPPEGGDAPETAPRRAGAQG